MAEHPPANGAEPQGLQYRIESAEAVIVHLRRFEGETIRELGQVGIKLTHVENQLQHTQGSVGNLAVAVVELKDQVSKLEANWTPLLKQLADSLSKKTKKKRPALRRIK